MPDPEFVRQMLEGWPTATGHKSMSSGQGSCLQQRAATRCKWWRRVWASVVQWCGAGNGASPEEGADGLLRDKTRKPGKRPIAAETAARVVALTCAEPPHQATHWTGRAMARAAGISLASVQRIWQAHKLQLHRVRTFKRSRDPEFAAKLTNIVDLYMDPPTQAVVLSIDEKSQIQALDRTQPGLPIKPGCCGTMTHDYKRHSKPTLFAALNVLGGTVIGRCMQQHPHEDSSASLTRSSAPSPQVSWSKPWSITTRPTNF